ALEKRGYEAMAISALARTNLEPLLWKALELLKTSPQVETAAELPVYRPPEDARDFTIERVEDGWQIHGAAIERAAEMTYWEYEGSVRRFQHLMDTLGVDAALRKAGIEEGDTVYIGENELEWQD
ncbi:MAG TPA: Obg family GTPase CgtA, partial [Anaerolineaceae bacterium]|nr:Obg family GTPase CgtA [Anaerolineaceae bacterium]